MAPINMQTASEFEMSKILDHRIITDVIGVRKRYELNANILGKYTDVPEKQWKKWEENQIVSFGGATSLQSDLFYDMRDLDTSMRELNVKLERQEEELQAERERRKKAEFALEQEAQQRKWLGAMPADSIYTRKPSDRKQSETKQNRKSKIHDTKDTHIHSKSNMFDNTYDENTRGRKYHRKTRYQSSSSSSSSSSLSSSSSSSSSDSDYDRHHHRRRHRQKSRSPTSKLQTFSGDGKISWDTFITQFERVADRHDWGKKKRTDKLLVA
ncbi:protein FAM133-like [Saccostrea echinata]|uniref:protein FAM133-like n=1 Tax=Saccostrea echinata TaxID=191078 RepID=UPI002A81A7FE|nr:protein FAM133-like [Saccostrea echinata]